MGCGVLLLHGRLAYGGLVQSKSSRDRGGRFGLPRLQRRPKSPMDEGTQSPFAHLVHMHRLCLGRGLARAGVCLFWGIVPAIPPCMLRDIVLGRPKAPDLVAWCRARSFVCRHRPLHGLGKCDVVLLSVSDCAALSCSAANEGAQAIRESKRARGLPGGIRGYCAGASCRHGIRYWCRPLRGEPLRLLLASYGLTVFAASAVIDSRDRGFGHSVGHLCAFLYGMACLLPALA